MCVAFGDKERKRVKVFDPRTGRSLGIGTTVGMEDSHMGFTRLGAPFSPVNGDFSREYRRQMEREGCTFVDTRDDVVILMEDGTKQYASLVYFAEV